MFTDSLKGMHHSNKSGKFVLNWTHSQGCADFVRRSCVDLTVFDFCFSTDFCPLCLKMPQELHVVQCYSCRMYQVDIVKKVQKWTCKLCGEKQSLKQVFFKGSGKECRLNVQQLNELKGNSFVDTPSDDTSSVGEDFNERPALSKWDGAKRMHENVATNRSEFEVPVNKLRKMETNISTHWKREENRDY